MEINHLLDRYITELFLLVLTRGIVEWVFIGNHVEQQQEWNEKVDSIGGQQDWVVIQVFLIEEECCHDWNHGGHDVGGIDDGWDTDPLLSSDETIGSSEEEWKLEKDFTEGEAGKPDWKFF